MSRLALLGILLLAWPLSAASQEGGELYRRACDDGDTYVCNILGLMYEAGEGVSKDLARAADLYRLACEGGELMGCTNLGLMYEAGVGFAPDTARAMGLLRVACEGGQELGCARLDRLESEDRLPGFASTGRFSRSGLIGDVDTRAPLANAVIALPELGIHAVSDPTGHFELEGIPAGRYLVRAERLGYGVVTAELEFPGSADVVLLMRHGPVGDLEAPGRIEGRVSDGTRGQGLADVEVSVVGQPEARTLSNQDGRFRLRGVEAGLADVRFARLGYAPRTATLVVQPNRTAEVSATMVSEPIELEAIQVTARPSHLEQNGFFARYERGRGTLFTPQDLQRIDPIVVSDILKERVPGVRIQYGAGGEARVVTKRASGLSLADAPTDLLLNDANVNVAPRIGQCVMEVYVDGMRQFDDDLDRHNPEQIQAMEIYQGVAVPIEFTSSFNSCGVVLLWTRRGS